MKPLPPPPLPNQSIKPPADRLLVLLAFAPILLTVLMLLHAPTFEDPFIEDQVVLGYPRSDRATSPTLEFVGNWELTPGGARPLGSGATIRVQLPKGPWRQAFVTVAGDVRGDWGVRFSRDFQRNTALGIRPGVERIFDEEQLPGAWFTANTLGMELFPAGEGIHQIHRIRVRLSAEDAFSQPSLPGIVMGALLPLLLASFFRYAGRRTSRQAVLTGGIFGTAAVFLGGWEADTLPYLWAAGTAFALGGASGALFKMVQARRAKDEERASELFRAFQCLALIAIAGFALQARWDVLGSLWSMPLSQDALGYMEIAVFGSFYETLQTAAPWIREPLFPAWLRMWFTAAPVSFVSARAAGIPIGILVVVLTFLVGRKLLNPWAALAAAAYMAVNPYAAGQSIEALRDDLLTALFLALACLPLYLGNERWGRAIAWGLAGAGLGLLRVNALLFVIVVGGVEAWRRRWHPGEILLAFGLLLLPVLPHLAFNAKVSDGDWLFSSNVHTRYYYNLLGLGEPGFPADFADWEANPYAGEVVGSTALLTYPSLPAAAVRTAEGFFRIFIKDFPHYRIFGGNLFLMAFCLAGLWAISQRRDAWWFFLWTAFFLAPVTIIAGIRFDQRLALPAMPAILMLWGMGVWQVAMWLRQVAERQGTKEDS